MALWSRRRFQMANSIRQLIGDQSRQLSIIPKQTLLEYMLDIVRVTIDGEPGAPRPGILDWNSQHSKRLATQPISPHAGEAG